MRTVSGMKQVPVGPLRDQFIRKVNNGEFTLKQAAERLGWLWNGETGKGATARLERTLGLRPYNPSNGYASRYRNHVTYDTAEAMCKAFGIDPFEVGV